MSSPLSSPPGGKKAPPDTPPEVRAARYNLIAVLLAALIGSVLGAWGTNYITNKQLAANEMRSDEEFVREQRRDAYADFIAEADSLRSLEQSLQAAHLTEPYPYDPDRVQETIDAYEDLVHSKSLVSLVGSEAAVEQADQLFQLHEKVTAGLLEAGGILSGQPHANLPSDASEEAKAKRLLEIANTVNESAQQLEEAMQQFVDAARKGLGSPAN